MKHPKRYQYQTTLFAPLRGGIYAGFPFDGKKEFGTNGPVRIKCWIDGVYREGSLIPMGGGEHAIHIRKEIRKKIGKDEGDDVSLIVEQNLEPRRVEIPEDFQWLLNEDVDLEYCFQKLSISDQIAIIYYINEAKRPETRVKRIEDIIKRVKVRFHPGRKLE